MSLYNQIMKARDELLNSHAEICNLHLGWRSERSFIAAARGLAGRGDIEINKWMGMDLEVGPSGTGPDYVAISYKKSENDQTRKFIVIQR